MLDIEFYTTDTGERPFVTWLESLKDTVARAQIKVRLDRLRLGNFGHCDPVGEGVSELKVHYGPGYRVYFSRIGKCVVLLLCGGNKQSQSKDIAKAKRYWAYYKEQLHEKK